VSSDHFIAGVHSVRTALKHGGDSVTGVWVETRRKDRRIKEIVSLAREIGVDVTHVGKDELDRMVPGANHQGVVANAKAPAALDERALKSLLETLQEPAFLLILDGVQDPHNLGACLRSADAAGVHAVVAPKDRSVGLTPTACKVASGAAETIPFIQVTNLSRILKWLRDEQGIWVIGTAGEAEQSLFEARLTGPLAIIMGGEESGLRRLTRENCDQLVKLPMTGSVESLNVSVAAGVCLYEALRQRKNAES
jgi:23S rRNA (guanosine2251-2'-O)-methyltransferase